jgi:glutaredoxin
VAPVTLTLLTKPGCHLCDDARAVVQRVAVEVGERGVVVAIDEQSILDDANLEDTFHDDIPVVFIGDEFHAQWRIDPDALRASLLDAAGN